MESVPISEETETMWKTLARVGLENHQFYIAERCYAALGDVAKARYLRETNKIAAEQTVRLIYSLNLPTELFINSKSILILI